MTLGPIAAAFGFWALATRIRHGWIAHLLFLPALLGLEWLMMSVLFWGARDDGNGPPGLGVAMIPACGALLVTVLLYYGTLASHGAAALIRKVTSSRRPIVR